MSPTLSARLCALVLVGAVAFQCCLVAGLPWGEFAWGGRFPGQLPVAMRLASAVSALLMLFMGGVILVRAGLWLRRWQPLSKKLSWVVVGYFALGVVANALTPSVWERAIWLPVTLTLLATSWVVARTP